jgi:hypothetical protein
MHFDIVGIFKLWAGIHESLDQGDQPTDLLPHQGRNPFVVLSRIVETFCVFGDALQICSFNKSVSEYFLSESIFSPVLTPRQAPVRSLLITDAIGILHIDLLPFTFHFLRICQALTPPLLFI